MTINAEFHGADPHVYLHRSADRVWIADLRPDSVSLNLTTPHPRGNGRVPEMKSVSLS